MKILFMGTPDIAAECLKALADRHEIVGVVCQPDRPKGRGYTLTPPPVKTCALERGIPVYQPATLKDDGFAALLSELAPELIAVVAYGKILPGSVIRYPKYGCINVHASLLPKYRGAAPMQRAIMNGEGETGVTIMQMDEGLDTGDMLLWESFPITEQDNFETVHDKTAALGAELLLRTVALIAKGEAIPVKQSEEGASYAAKITKEDCLLNFSLTKEELLCRIRGLSPMPLAFTKTPNGKLLKVISAVPSEEQGECGRVLSLSDKGEGGITVGCQNGAVTFTCVLPEGKGRMSAADAVRGRRIAVGDLLG